MTTASVQYGRPARGQAKKIAKVSWVPVLFGAGLYHWGPSTLAWIGVTLWVVGIVLQLYAGYLHFVKRDLEGRPPWGQ